MMNLSIGTNQHTEKHVNMPKTLKMQVFLILMKIISKNYKFRNVN